MAETRVQVKQEDATDPRLSGLLGSLGNVATLGPAPVDSWNPPFCGDIDIRIAADGTWFHAGTPIHRPALVRLFASVLRKDPDRFVLVTPVERLGIDVEDAPFVAAAMDEHDGCLRFVTNVGDVVEAGTDHPLRFAVGKDGGVKPYLLVREGLWARLTRPLAFELLERVENGDEGARVRSGGIVFAIPSQGAD